MVVLDGRFAACLALPAAYLTGRPSSFMFIFYVDESGSPHAHREPLQHGDTPLFVLASLALQASRWRALDRAYRGWKARFFAKEIGARRPEQFEVKGTELIGPHNRSSRRRHSFARRVFRLCLENQVRGFAVVLRKDAANPTSATSMYTMALQYLTERFQCFLDETASGASTGLAAEDAQAVVIADSRMNNLDLNVAVSHLSYIFGNPVGQTCTRIIEAPTFTFSQLSVGLQLTDIFASYVYARAYQRHCAALAGAVSYAHLDYFAEYGDRLEFRSAERYNGYQIRGLRFIGFGAP